MRIRDQFLYRILRVRKTIERRWYIALGTVLVMLPVAFAAHEATGVYYSKADVLVLAPALEVNGNALQADPMPMLSFASVVVHRFTDEDGETAPHGTSAPLYGSGIRKGHLVYIPSSGGQWQLSYNRAVITVEVVAESTEEVAAKRDEIVKRISVLAKASQQEMAVNAANLITTDLAPGTAFVSYVGVRNSRAEAALIVLTFGLALGIPLLADRLMARTRTGGGPRRRTRLNTGGAQQSKPPQPENEMGPSYVVRSRAVHGRRSQPLERIPDSS